MGSTHGNRGCVWRRTPAADAVVDRRKGGRGQLILLTGNTPDVFSAAIEASADTIQGLGILPVRCGTP